MRRIALALGLALLSVPAGPTSAALPSQVFIAARTTATHEVRGNAATYSGQVSFGKVTKPGGGTVSTRLARAARAACRLQLTNGVTGATMGVKVGSSNNENLSGGNKATITGDGHWSVPAGRPRYQADVYVKGGAFVSTSDAYPLGSSISRVKLDGKRITANFSAWYATLTDVPPLNP